MTVLNERFEDFGENGFGFFMALIAKQFSRFVGAVLGMIL